MNKYSSILVDNLMKRSDNTAYLKLIEKLFITGIPFNIPHKLKFIEMSSNRTQILLPFIRHNKNHLGGVHACATATLGELPAGLTLVKRFGSSKFRLIMQELNANYIRQAKEELIGTVEIQEKEFLRVKQELDTNELSYIEIKTSITTKKESELIAVIKTKWQIKSWNEVRYK